MKRIVFALFVAGVLNFSMNAQEFTMPVLSPSSKLVQQFSTSSITVEYSRPSARNRIIFGEVVPFGKAWRTGANASTKLIFGEDVTFGGTPIKAGTYSLYTIPNQNEWTIILNKDLQLGGNVGDYKQENDVARIKVKVISTKEKTETLTIDLNDITTTSATLCLTWDYTKIPIEIKADNKDRILKYLDKELNATNPIYQKAANYYLDQNYKLNDALIYINKAIEGNPNAYWLYATKSKICLKLNLKEDAIKAAEMAVEKTKGTDSEAEYKKNLEQIKNDFK